MQQTVSVTQSLALLNDEVVYDWARAMARRVLNDGDLPADALASRL